MNKNIYQKLKKLELKYQGIKRGLDFLEFFSQELNNLKLKKGNSDIQVYDFIRGEYIFLNVNIEEFDNEIKQIFKKFIREKFLSSYSWYIKFLKSLDIFLEKKYHVDKKKKDIYSFIHELMTTCFLINSSTNNRYDYKKLSDFLLEMFCVAGFEPNDSIELTSSILSHLIKEGIFVVEKKYLFGSPKIIGLSDSSFDCVFGNTRLFLPSIVCKSTGSILHYSDIDLNNLNLALNNFEDFLNKFESMQNFKVIFSKKFPKLINDLSNYGNSDIDFSCLEYADYDDIEALYGLYYINLMLNEYCFSVIAMSCFKYYYQNPGDKSILFSQII